VDLTTASNRNVPLADRLAFAERDSDRTVVWLRGEHDASTVTELWETMGQAIALDDADLVVDLSGVEFMGSATVGVIIRARESLRPRSRSLTVRCPSRCAQRVLDLYGLSELLDCGPVETTLGPWADFDSTSVAGWNGS
jgi:anti-sigma B factor antagonist